MRFVVIFLILISFGGTRPAAADEGDVVTRITVRAPRDMGYFAGDLVKADIDIDLADGYVLDEASLPHTGPIAYWLDLRKIGVASQLMAGATSHYTLRILYQNFYDALDARPQEIPTFPVTFTKGTDKVTANVPAWTIGVSPLREIAPPVKTDPKDYLRADEPAPYRHAAPVWWSAGALAFLLILALGLLAHDRAWAPFRRRPTRIFAESVRKLRVLAQRPDRGNAYLGALLILHRSIDQTAGQRVFADDVPIFLKTHSLFMPTREGFSRFFAASRSAFFGSDPVGAQTSLGFDALLAFARELAVVERTKP